MHSGFRYCVGVCGLAKEQHFEELYSNRCISSLISDTMAGEKLPVQIRTRKFIRNALLARRQFVSY